MKKGSFYIFSFGLLVVLTSTPLFAQEKNTRRSVSAASSLYVVSAKAGGVNFVEGAANVERQAGKSGVLLKGDSLEIGDKVSTAANGKAEILLNPGSFVRLAGNSEFEFTTVALEDLQLKLNAGSAIFEVITDNEFTFAVNTPKAKFFVVKSGVYRVDVTGDGTSKIEVWKGKAQIGDVYQTEVKGGREAVVNGAQVTVAKFDRDEKDEFETFSKARAKELAKVNKSLQNRDVRTSLMSSFYNTRWSLYDSYGLWVFNRAFGSYAFLPFGYGWNSPYGYYYNCDIWRYNLPWTIYNYNPVIYSDPTNPTNPPTPGVRIDAAGIKTPPALDGGRDETPVRVRPLYMKLQNEIGSSPVYTENPGNDLASPFPTMPVRSPSAAPSSAAPSSAAPSSAAAPPVSVAAPPMIHSRKESPIKDDN